MTGADGTYDYKAMAAGIVLAGGEGMGNLLPVVEKELLGLRVKMCVWLGVSRGLDLAFLNAD